MSEHTDNELHRMWLAQIADGGPQGRAAFDLFHDRFQKDVLSQISKVVSLNYYGRAVHEELAQEVWIKLWSSSAAKYKEKYPPSGWIKVVAKNHAKNFLRRKENQLKIQEMDDSMAHDLHADLSEEGLVESQLCFEWAFDQMELCCKDCEDILRAIIDEGLSNSELADRLNTTVRAATQKLYECRQCLRGLIERC